jgi:DNA-binding NtrC family response regulator
VVLAKSEQVGAEEVEMPTGAASSSTPSLPNTANLEALEKEMILRELRAQDGNRRAVAEALGISKSTLYDRLKKYGIT